VGKCFFWYQLTQIVPEKIQRAKKTLATVSRLTWVSWLPLALVFYLFQNKTFGNKWHWLSSDQMSFLSSKQQPSHH